MDDAKSFPRGKSMRRIDPPFPSSLFAKRPFIVSMQYLPFCPSAAILHCAAASAPCLPSSLSRNHAAHYSLADLIRLLLRTAFPPLQDGVADHDSRLARVQPGAAALAFQPRDAPVLL
jgi:hypothetical protein